MGGRIGRLVGATSVLALAFGLLGAPSVGAAGGIPGAPTAVTTSAGPDIGQIRLTWTAPTDTGTGITTYLIARASVVNGVVGPFGAPASTYSAGTSSVRTCPETYPDRCAFRIAARSSVGTSEWSETAIADWGVPSAVRGLSASSTDFSTVDLAWTAPLRTGGLAYTYRLQVSEDSRDWRDLAAGVAGTSYRAANGCQGATTCTYRARAENPAGAGDWSNTPTIQTAPAIVRYYDVVFAGADLAVNPGEVSDNFATVSWSAPTRGMPPVAYQIERCLDICSATTGVWQLSRTVPVAPSYSVPETCPGGYQTCTYRTRAVNARGGVGPWALKSMQPFAPRPPTVSDGPTPGTVKLTLYGVGEVGSGPVTSAYFTFFTCPSDCSVEANWTEVPESERVYLATATYPSEKIIGCSTGPLCSIRAQFVDGNGVPGPVTQYTSVVPELFTPVATVASSCTPLATIGDQVTCAITVTNNSTGPAPDLVGGVITDTVAGDLTGTPSPRVTVTTNTCVDGTGAAVPLAKGVACSIGFRYVVLPTDPDPIVDVTTVHYQPEGVVYDVAGSGSSTTELYQPSVNAQKTCTASVRLGESAACTVVVTNDGSADTPNLAVDSVSDTVVGNLLGTLSRGSKTACPAWPGAGLAAQATWTCAYSFATIASDPNPITNTVTVRAHPTGTAVSLVSTAQASITLDTPTVAIAKTASTPTPVVGQTVTYVVTVTNTTWTGGPALTFVTDPATRLFDSIAGDLLGTLARGTRSGASTCTTSTSLAPAGSCSVTYSYAITAGDPDQHVNAVSTLMRAGSYQASASTSVQVDVAHPDLLVTTQCIGGTVKIGDTAIFDGSVTNTGDVPLTGVTISDPGATSATVAGSSVTFPFVIALLPPGSSVVLQDITVVATSENVIGSQLRNTLTATATFGPVLLQRSADGGCAASGGQVEGAARGPGFWMTHPEYTTHVFQDALGSRIDLGWRVLTTPAQVMGMYWANDARNSDGTRRDPVCQTQVQGSFHLLTAILNSGLTNAAAPAIDPVSGLDAISAMRAALVAGDPSTIRRLQGLLEGKANGPASGVSIVDASGARPGPADPSLARDLADPTIADC